MEMPSLVICGKDLDNGGKLDRISGLNIVNLTLLRSNICYRSRYFRTTVIIELTLNLDK
jgi:hypothetical protein